MSGQDDFRIRLMQETDLDTVMNWRNSERIRMVMFNDHLISQEEHRAWFKRFNDEGNAFCFIFEINGRPVGVVNVERIDKRNSKCYWGFYLGESDVPKSSGTKMGYLALKYIFEELNIRKLCSEVLASNLQSIRFHKKLGFVREGLFIKHVSKNGRFEDVIAMALFASEWKKQKETLEELLFKWS